jgi:hypothetical protein
LLNNILVGMIIDIKAISNRNSRNIVDGCTTIVVIDLLVLVVVIVEDVLVEGCVIANPDDGFT